MTTPPRLVVVSAHFPPNFVSGGTLVPDRQARGLQARGWDVSVYAGHLERGRPAFETSDQEIDGLPVRWIEVEPFTSWADERNFHNPEVTADFEAHLADVRPDVVHLHSLQAVGAGLLPAAKRHGAKTVVTMHDFWWCCGRQFLVDPAGNPCCLVVDAGACGCAVDESWRDRRQEHLLRLLDDADLILAPSEVAAGVLRANGVPGDRLEVDENGLATKPPPVRRPRPESPVMFRYAGGADVLKGAEVVVRAARRLGGGPGVWRLVVHGDERRLRDLGPWPVPVQIEPPFAPDDLDAVMAATDVLLVPSLARESHSLVTREALLRGVPVICSDSLGPEEVVRDGRNGLVVPTGDPDALASAMRLAVDRPDMRAAWSAAAVDVPVRMETDRLDALDRRLRALLTQRPHHTRRSRAHGIEQVLFICGIDGAPLRYRAHLPAEALAWFGVTAEARHYRDPALPVLLERADAVILYRAPATEQLVQLVEDLKASRPGVPIIFDVDDLIFDPDLTSEVPALGRLAPAEAALWLEGVRRYRTTMELADLYVGSTEVLCDHAAAVTGLPTMRFANGVGRILSHASDVAVRRPRTPGPLRVGYLSGTTTHDGDWAMIEGAVVDALLAHPDAELWLGGLLTPSQRVEELGPRLRRLPMVPWTQLPDVLRDLDVNLAPLEPVGRFNEAKSAIKWLEAALCSTPTIASPTQPFRESIEPLVNGLLADHPEAWRAGLERLLADDLLRARLGARARRDALLRWSPRLQGERYLEILMAAKELVADGRAPRPSTWVPVTLDEPFEPTPLSPYLASSEEVQVVRSARVRRAAEARARKFLREWEEGGPWHATRRATRAALRDARRLVTRLRR